MIILSAIREHYDEHVRDWLRWQYFENKEVRQLADKIHNHRMMSPPACLDCIQMAVERIGIHSEPERSSSRF